MVQKTSKTLDAVIISSFVILLVLLVLIIVVPPRDWTPGEVKARKYNKPKKGGYHDTATTIYSGVQSASGARSAQWSTESGSTLSPASAQPTAACALEDRISGTSSPPF